MLDMADNDDDVEKMNHRFEDSISMKVKRMVKLASHDVGDTGTPSLVWWPC